MSSRTAVKTSYLRVMEETGFYRNGEATNGIIEAEDLRNDIQQLEKRIKYSPVIDPQQINATAIFELSGSPCIYFKEIEQNDPNPQEIARLHKLSWNHGLAPILWVVTPTKVLLYNCYSQPQKEDENNPEKHLIEVFQQTEKELKRINQYASRLQFESGEFWQWSKAKQINRNQRVDSVLVKDLTDTEEILVDDKGLKRSIAHTLLIQSIFIAYLQDREILNPELLERNCGFDNLNNILENKSATNKLFKWIKDTFNGDFFSLNEEELDSIKTEHLEIIQAFISGQQEIKTGQLRLWRAYDFKVIPIELISSIYEKFIYAENAQLAKENSTYYTPINLVDLVLSETFKPLDGKAKVLDLSCGSGVFLVDSLRRLVVKRIINGEEYSRQLIRDTLYNQIYGVDINKKAIQITAFSLYLTTLELDYELDKNPVISDDLIFQSIINKNLFASDAFDENAEFNQVEVFAEKQFNAIVGNPPWTKLKGKTSASEYCKKNDYPTADINGTPPDQCLLWRVGDFCNENTNIGLILKAQRFFNNSPKAQKAKESIFKHFKPRIIVNLSKIYRENLFPNSKAPALIFIGEYKQASAKDNCYFVCVERLINTNYKNNGILEISPENIKKLPVFGIASNPFMLKIATWGNARDLYLIQKLNNDFYAIEEVFAIFPKDVLKGKDTSFFVMVCKKVTSNGIYATFIDQDTIYDKSQIICSQIPLQSELQGRYLNAILNSSLASYFLFMTSSPWGIERNTIMKQDLCAFKIPKIEDVNSELLNKIVNTTKRIYYVKDEHEFKNLEQQLDNYIFRIYNLDELERVLVEDTKQFTIDWYMNREKSKAICKPKISELKLYAQYLIKVIQPFLQTMNVRKIVADIIDVDKVPLQIVKFSIISQSTERETIQTISGKNLQEILKSIAQQLPQQIADKIYTRRDLRIYTEDDIYIIKPAKRIYWTRSAGLNDADIILSESLKTKQNYDSIR